MTISCCPWHYEQGIMSPLVFDPETPGRIKCQWGCDRPIEELPGFVTKRTMTREEIAKEFPGATLPDAANRSEK